MSVQVPIAANLVAEFVIFRRRRYLAREQFPQRNVFPQLLLEFPDYVTYRTLAGLGFNGVDHAFHPDGEN
jgi:hypothetical protein